MVQAFRFSRCSGGCPRGGERGGSGFLSPSGVDNVDGRPEGLLYIQMLVSSKRASSAGTRGAVAAAGIAGVAAADVGQHVLVASRPRRGRRARGQRRRARTSGVAVTKSFTVASGQMTVPMSRPSSTAPSGLAREGALPVDQRGAHRRDGGDDRGRLAHLAAAQPRLVEMRRGRAPGRRARRPPRRRAGSRSRISAHADGAVEQAGVEMRQAEMQRPAAWRACPCRRPRDHRRR